MVNNGSSSGLRHLKKKHKINNHGEGIRRNSAFSTSPFEAAITTAATVTNLVTRFNFPTFRYLFIRWIIIMHIALTCIESDTFRAWVLYIAPALNKYLVESGDIIHRWIMKEFERQRLEMKAELVTAYSRIHVSFNLWTSPNGKGLVGVIFHYLDKNLKVCSLLAGIRRINGPYSSENIAEAVIPVLLIMGIKDRIGFFIGDNASPNDTAIRAILDKIRPDIKDPDSRRVRCVGHIINLAAKAFLFGKDADAFVEESQTKKQLSRFEAVRELWRKKEPLGKFYNTVNFIQKNP